MDNHYRVVGMVLSGLFCGWTIGSHYTGAPMGTAYGSGVIKNPLTATILVAICVILGATFESHNVGKTVQTLTERSVRQISRGTFPSQAQFSFSTFGTSSLPRKEIE